MADQFPNGSTEPGQRDPGSTAELVSFGFLIDETCPTGAEDLCRRIAVNAPGQVRVELLLLDDHLNPARRELVDVIDGHGDSVRLVPRPGGGPCARLDAASLSSCSEFLIVPIGSDAPLEGLAEATSQLFADGTDVVTIIDTSNGDGERDGPPPDGPVGDLAVGDLAVGDLAVGDRAVGDDCDRLAAHLGLGNDELPDRVVLIRRWVARWLFSEVDRSVDPADEIAERARLLGLRMLVVDPSGLAVS